MLLIILLFASALILMGMAVVAVHLLASLVEIIASDRDRMPGLGSNFFASRWLNDAFWLLADDLRQKTLKHANDTFSFVRKLLS
ncbi:hypothetical protein ABIE09_004496 [Lysobacter enzymogenes]|uniref:hypothetical protein n=1 Tax=Lysobacter enzymogenes TaxID=69 RepID=UPI00339A739B